MQKLNNKIRKLDEIFEVKLVRENFFNNKNNC